MLIDLFSGLRLARAIDADEGAGSNTAKASEVIDLANVNRCTLVIITGTLADSDAVFSVKVEESDATAFGGEQNLVDASHLQIDPGLDATPASSHQCAFDFADDDKQFKIGYLGSKRYLKLTITPADNTGAWDIAAVALLSGLRKQPA